MKDDHANSECIFSNLRLPYHSSLLQQLLSQPKGRYFAVCFYNMYFERRSVALRPDNGHLAIDNIISSHHSFNKICFLCNIMSPQKIYTPSETSQQYISSNSDQNHSTSLLNYTISLLAHVPKEACF